MELLDVVHLLEAVQLSQSLVGDIGQSLALALELEELGRGQSLAGVHAAQPLEGRLGGGVCCFDSVLEVLDLLGDVRHDRASSLGCNIYFYT